VSFSVSPDHQTPVVSRSARLGTNRAQRPSGAWKLWYGIFRLGAWPDFYPGVQFSRDPEALNQFFRQMVTNTGPYDAQVNTEAVSALFNKIGPGILVTHSQRYRV
jgi:hypothetical protein